MIRKTAFALLLSGAAVSAQAHEVWIERDGSGPARIYLGEPAEPLPEGGDPEFDKLKAPKLIPAQDAQLVRRAGYLEVAVPEGDVRAYDDAVFAPWGPEGKKESVVYYARAGRNEARAVMPYEIAPAVAGGDSFVFTRDGKPVAGAHVTVVSPDKWSKIVVTDAQGTVAVPRLGPGRYLLAASHKDTGKFATPAGEVAVLHHTATTTFIAP